MNYQRNLIPADGSSPEANPRRDREAGRSNQLSYRATQMRLLKGSASPRCRSFLPLPASRCNPYLGREVADLGLSHPL